MMMYNFRLAVVFILGISLFVGCSTVKKTTINSLAYFNTYYNDKRLMLTAEDEFLFQDEKNRVQKEPRVIVVEPSTLLEDNADYHNVPKFLEPFIITRERWQVVESQLDSILIKGSKILTRHAKSDYVDGALYLMAKAYFYKNQWFNCQLTCQELLDVYPYSVLSPDTHLLVAKAFLIQKKFPQGEEALSRAIDIAWGQKRYDALSEAFRLQAELALHRNSIDDAVKPYRRAVAQTEDAEQRAKWQTDLGIILYRTHQYQAAVDEFDKVNKLGADILAEFETRLYRAAALGRLGRYEEAEKSLQELQDNKNFKEWWAWVAAEKINLFRISGQLIKLETTASVADTAYAGHSAMAAARYQRALLAFRSNEEKLAYDYFAASQIASSPVFSQTQRYVKLLEHLQSLPLVLNNLQTTVKMQASSNRDTLLTRLASQLFLLARTNELLGRPDSALPLYGQARIYSPLTDTARARYMYAEARLLERHSGKNTGVKRLRDSLLTLLIEHHTNTDYAMDAAINLGYTAHILNDTAATLFLSADQHRAVGNYTLALQQLQKISLLFPRSTFAARALYVSGWLFENHFRNTDSAVHYYLALVERYPESVYAKEVYSAVEMAFKAREEKLEAERIKKSLDTSSTHGNDKDTLSSPPPSAGKITAPAKDPASIPLKKLQPGIYKDTVFTLQSGKQDTTQGGNKTPPPSKIKDTKKTPLQRKGGTDAKKSDSSALTPTVFNDGTTEQQKKKHRRQ